MSCSETHRLELLENEPLSGNLITELLEHISSCEECFQQLQQNRFLLFDSEEANAELKAVLELEKLSEEVECKSLLARMKDQRPEHPGTSSSTLRGSLPPGTILDDFQLTRIIACGGMGIVYEAVQLSLDRTVALKVLSSLGPATELQIQRFKNEALVVGSLDHSNIIPILAFGTVDGIHFLVMNYIEGCNLARLIKAIDSSTESGMTGIDTTEQYESDRVDSDQNQLRDFDDEFSINDGNSHEMERAKDRRFVDQLELENTKTKVYVDRMVRQFVKVIEALQYAHSRGIIHRDIKPSNLILDESGKLWVGDFGVAKLDMAATITKSNILIGTPRYMSPEQALGNRAAVDYRADIYGMGVTLYETLTLQPFFEATSIEEVIHSIINVVPTAPTTLNPAISTDLETIILKATAKEARDRYSSALSFANDLQNYLDNKPIMASRPTVLSRIRKWTKRNKLIATISSLLFLAITFLAITMTVYSYRISEVNHNLRIAEADSRKAYEKVAAALDDSSEKNYLMSVMLASDASKKHDSTRVNALLEPFIPKEGQKDIRGLEWYAVNNDTLPITDDLKVSQSALYAIDISPDGSVVAVAGAASIIHFVDVASMQVIDTLDTEQTEVNSLDFSSDGTHIVSAGDDRTLRIWDVQTKELLQTITTYPDPEPGGVKYIAVGVKYTPDNQFLISSANDKKLKKWSIPSGEQVGEFVGHDDDTRAFDISRDGKYLVTGSFDRTVRMWEMESQKEINIVGIPEVDGTTNLSIQSVSFSLDGKAVVVGTKNAGVCQWEWRQDTLRIIGVHKDPVSFVCYSNYQQEVFACDRSGAVKIWNVGSDTLPNQALRLTPLDSRQVHTGRIYAACLTIDGSKLLSVGEDGCVKGVELVAKNVNSKISEYRAITTYAHSPESERLVVILNDGKVVHGFENREGKITRIWRVVRNGVSAACYAKGSDVLITAYGTGEVLANHWRLNGRSYREFARWKLPFEGRPTYINYSDKCGSMLVDNEKHDIYLYKLLLPPSGKVPAELVQISKHRGFHTILAPDEMTFAFVDNDVVYVCSANSGEVIHQLNAGIESGVNCIAYSPTSPRLYIADGTRALHVWDFQKSDSAEFIVRHDSSVSSLALSPDDKTLLISGLNSTLSFYSLQGRIQLHQISYPMLRQMEWMKSGQLLAFAKTPANATRNIKGHKHDFGYLQTLSFGEEWERQFNEFATSLPDEQPETK
ncbi:Serine/threonine-protein kinase PknB [Polystyrenella longa]|uniref:Serine/threonine-protein kinase PknB n=1 Tax=Polystyrenella longa TaxID=2528007 RepID=A0A518CGU5_9PLAN|nr:protein kinase [Polystyrenella longa]QDU78451.1 Serine/threonine-protein kinase PknB [Polystyrenella longa]